MKKITLCLMTISLSLILQPRQLKATGNPTSESVVIPEPLGEVSAGILLKRLNQIDEMDKSNLRPFEKKKLRQELRSIEHQLKASNNGGVYISIGAAIIIGLLLSSIV